MSDSDTRTCEGDLRTYSCWVESVEDWISEDVIEVAADGSVLAGELCDVDGGGWGRASQ